MPEYVWVRNARGKEYAVVASAVNPEIHDVVQGATVALDAYGIPRREESLSDIPTKSASKGEWAEYAVARGMDPDEAEAATKADLIATYGKEN